MTSIATVIAIIAGLLGSAGLGGVFAKYLDHKAGERKQTDEVALAMAQRLGERVDKLEKQQVIERERCDVELRNLRHRISGWKQLFYSLMHLLDLPEGRRREALGTIRDQMATLEQTEALETGALMGSRVYRQEDPGT